MNYKRGRVESKQFLNFYFNGDDFTCANFDGYT